MKDQRHKRKESFSILLVSNTSGSSRQLHFSQSALRLLSVLAVLLCAAVLLMAWLLASAKKAQSNLQAQLLAQTETITSLEAENTALLQKNKTLENENKALGKQHMDILMAAANADGEEDGESSSKPETSSAFPGLYPSSETVMLIDTYSPEQPYLSINTHLDSHVIAAGDGTVVAISSDDTYPVIIEIEHETGHKTRYMCRQNAEQNTETGAKVSAGDTLLTITADNTQLDYQVIFEGEIIDPFNVIDAKG